MGLRSTIRDGISWGLGASGLADASIRRIHSAATLRVFMYHDVPRDLAHNFAAHLQWISTTFEVIKPADLLDPQYVGGERPKALLTFDDGCVDNYDIVAPRLEQIGVRGLFFICPAFSDAGESESYRLMERSAGFLAEKNRDSRWHRMSPAQISDLDRRGHGIGNHTQTHAPLAHVPQDILHDEIVQSSDLLSDWLGHPCDCFAWTYYWDEITPQALGLIFNRHRLCFSPCSGLNAWPAGKLLWRTAIDVSKPLPFLKTQVSGVVDRFYRPKRELVISLVKKSEQLNLIDGERSAASQPERPR